MDSSFFSEDCRSEEAHWMKQEVTMFGIVF